MDVRLVDAEALVVGPDDKLLIRVKSGALPDGFQDALAEALVDLGLAGRTLTIYGDEFELAKVKAA